MYFSENRPKNRDLSTKSSKKSLISSLDESIKKSKDLFSYTQILDLSRNLLNNVNKEDFLLPISIFNKDLGALESIVKYLKENGKLKFTKIAALLGRNNIAIGNCYRNCLKKNPDKIKVRKSEFNIPTSIFKDRELSILENLVKHLKETYELRFKEISVLLHRDERTIWTVYNRALKKKTSPQTKQNEA